MNTKKDFELIAAIIRDAKLECSMRLDAEDQGEVTAYGQREIMRAWIADAFCREFKNMSTRFCPVKFRQACDV